MVSNSILYVIFKFIEMFYLPGLLVDTKPNHRNKGYAKSLCASLIILARERGIKVKWDAANEISMSLARKLGYSKIKKYNIIHQG